MLPTPVSARCCILASCQPGHAMTLWFIVFNNPSACGSSPCSIEDLLLNPAVQGDFLIAAGHVVGGNGQAVFGGALQVGDIRGSGWIELGNPIGQSA